MTVTANNFSKCYIRGSDDHFVTLFNWLSSKDLLGVKLFDEKSYYRYDGTYDELILNRRCTELNDTDLIRRPDSQTLTIEVEELDINEIASPTLARLIEEVRNEEELAANMYNRMHNRHNRSR